MQIENLRRGAHVLAATPGRLCDLIERGVVSLSEVKYLVLDEADRMLDMGFEQDIRRIIDGEGMPARGTRQTLMFSATFPDEIRKIAHDFLHEYVRVEVGQPGLPCQNVSQNVSAVIRLVGHCLIVLS